MITKSLKNYLKIISSIVILGSGIYPGYSQDDCKLLIWSDEFEYTGLPDSMKWGYDVGDGCDYGICNWGNMEAQYYTFRDTDNARVENGMLKIEARKELTVNKKYSSARLVTRDILEIINGRIEFRARLAPGKGTWSALWLLGDRENLGWPACGEIDVMEYVGAEPGIVRGTVHQTAAYGGAGPSMAIEVSDAETEFHSYIIDWNQDSMTWYVDDIPYHVYRNEHTGDAQWPYHRPFYLIMNLAVGGTLGGPIDNTIFENEVSMEIDYVRVYQRPSESAITGESTVVKNRGQLVYSSLIPAERYNWKFPSGVNIISGEGSHEVTVDWGCEEGDIELELETICDTALVRLPVTFKTMEITGKNSVYSDEAGLVFSVPPVSGGSYQWSVPPDAHIIGDSQGREINVTWGCNPGQVSVEVRGTCLETIVVKDVGTVRPVINGPGYISAGSSDILFSVDSLLEGTFMWEVPEGVSINGSDNEYQISVNWGSRAGFIKIQQTSSCGVVRDSMMVNLTSDLIIADFDVVDPVFLVFGGSYFEKTENPDKSGLNTSELTGMTFKDAAGTSWGGFYTDLDSPLDFSNGKTLSLLSWAPRTGNVLFKIESNTGAAGPIEISRPITKLKEWEKLLFDFNLAPGNTYNRIALFFDFGQVHADSFYFDYVCLERNLSPSIVLSQEGPITEGSEDGKVIHVDLLNDQFVPVLNQANWSFENLPEGVNVGTIERVHDNRVNLVLSGNCISDYDADIKNFSLTVKAAELINSLSDLNNNTGITFTALVEDLSEEMSLDRMVSVYPNPAGDLLRIIIHPSLNGKLKVRLLSVDGKVIQLFNMNAGEEKQLELRGISPGIYILGFEGKAGKLYREIIHN